MDGALEMGTILTCAGIRFVNKSARQTERVRCVCEILLCSSGRGKLSKLFAQQDLMNF